MTASVGNSEVGETQTVEQQDKNEHARSPTQQRRHGQGGGRHDEIGSSANPKTQAARMLSLRVELQTLHDRQPPRGLAVPGERGVPNHVSGAIQQRGERPHGQSRGPGILLSQHHHIGADCGHGRGGRRPSKGATR